MFFYFFLVETVCKSDVKSRRGIILSTGTQRLTYAGGASRFLECKELCVCLILSHSLFLVL